MRPASVVCVLRPLNPCWCPSSSRPTTVPTRSSTPSAACWPSASATWSSWWSTRARPTTPPRRSPPSPIGACRRPVACRQARRRGGVAGPPSRGRGRLHRPREAPRRPRVPLVHAPDRRLLPAPAGRRLSRRPRAGAARDAPVPAGGGADQAQRAEGATEGVRAGGRLRRDVVARALAVRGPPTPPPITRRGPRSWRGPDLAPLVGSPVCAARS